MRQDGRGKGQARRVVVFSGAGLSAESGLKTYRDHDGLWENHRIEDVATAQAFANHPRRVHDFMSARRVELGKALPNAAHLGLAALERDFPVLHVTQNIDDLLERAGCAQVVHLHGYLPEMQCLKCRKVWNIGYASYDYTPCPGCGADAAKPNIVLFGDMAPQYAVLNDLFYPGYGPRTLTRDDILVVLGTLGNVVPIGNLAYNLPCRKILNNLEDSPYIDAEIFDHVYLEPATRAIDKIAAAVRDLMAGP